MKGSTSLGRVATGIFVLATLLVLLAFFSRSWLVSDYRITGAFNRLGLWYHCYRSSPNEPNEQYRRRFFAGCRWIYDPFTTGYDQIRGYLVPTFMILTQFFYTLTFVAVLICGVGVLIFYFCCTPDEERFLPLTKSLGITLISAGVSAALAVLIFGLFANRDQWMPGHDNNYFGWSYFVAVASVVALLASGILFSAETARQRKLQEEMQSRFDIHHDMKS